jgi:hypothetical protein
VSASSEQKREAFRRVRDEISWKVREFLAQLHGYKWSANSATGKCQPCSRWNGKKMRLMEMGQSASSAQDMVALTRLC